MAASPAMLLHGLIRKESTSLLQYLSDAYPWAAAKDKGKLREVLALSRRERSAIGDLVRYCVRNRLGAPETRSYPERFMDLNFVSLDSLQPMLLDEQKKRVAELEWSILTMPDSARDLVKALLDVKRKTLAELQRLAAPVAS
jgi:hypothetical protein